MGKISVRRRGVSTIEYGLIASLIAMVAIAAILYLGGNTKEMYCGVAVKLGNPYQISNNVPCKTLSVLNQYHLSSSSSFEDVYNASGKSAGGTGYIAQYVFGNKQFIESLGISSANISRTNDSLPGQVQSACYQKYSDQGLAYACYVTAEQAVATYRNGDGWAG